MDVPFKQFGTQASWKDQWPPKSYNWKHQGWSQLEWWFHPQVRGAWGKVKAYKHPIGSIGVPQHFPSRAILVGSPATSSGRPGRQNISTGFDHLDPSNISPHDFMSLCRKPKSAVPTAFKFWPKTIKTKLVNFIYCHSLCAPVSAFFSLSQSAHLQLLRNMKPLNVLLEKNNNLHTFSQQSSWNWHLQRLDHTIPTIPLTGRTQW